VEKTDASVIVENLIAAIPVIHRKLVNFLDDNISQGLSHHHFSILGVLIKRGPLPVSEIGRRLMMSKPQMTAMIDKLFSLGLVARTSDPEDRRIINISITDQGKKVLHKAVVRIKENLEKKLVHLSQEDIELLSNALKNINIIGSKLD
jgi:DNA-binding MarR family transcriptional regulator